MMYLNLAQELIIVDQDPLFLVLLDLKKSCDNLDRGCLLKTLEGYGVGVKVWDILLDFCEQQEVVTQKNGYHGPHFRAVRVTTRGGMTSLTLFNVTVDSVVRY